MVMSLIYYESIRSNNWVNVNIYNATKNFVEKYALTILHNVKLNDYQ